MSSVTDQSIENREIRKRLERLLKLAQTHSLFGDRPSDDEVRSLLPIARSHEVFRDTLQRWASSRFGDVLKIQDVVRLAKLPPSGANLEKSLFAKKPHPPSALQANRREQISFQRLHLKGTVAGGAKDPIRIAISLVESAHRQPDSETYLTDFEENTIIAGMVGLLKQQDARFGGQAAMLVDPVLGAVREVDGEMPNFSTLTHELDDLNQALGLYAKTMQAYSAWFEWSPTSIRVSGRAHIAPTRFIGAIRTALAERAAELAKPVYSELGPDVFFARYRDFNELVLKYALDETVKRTP
ncbi:MAG: hypothetical protein R3C68_05105 [Myxococcota bacterium]